jgi:hypothetical protein
MQINNALQTTKKRVWKFNLNAKVFVEIFTNVAASYLSMRQVNISCGREKNHSPFFQGDSREDMKVHGLFLA